MLHPLHEQGTVPAGSSCNLECFQVTSPWCFMCFSQFHSPHLRLLLFSILFVLPSIPISRGSYPTSLLYLFIFQCPFLFSFPATILFCFSPTSATSFPTFKLCIPPKLPALRGVSRRSSDNTRDAGTMLRNSWVSSQSNLWCPYKKQLQKKIPAALGSILPRTERIARGFSWQTLKLLLNVDELRCVGDLQLGPNGKKHMPDPNQSLPLPFTSQLKNEIWAKQHRVGGYQESLLSSVLTYLITQVIEN